jgi:hypothetical protein
MKLDGKTLEELVALQEAICADPKNRNPKADSIFKYTKATHKKLDEIAWAITHKLRELRVARGETINDCGYSGRQTNRR